MSTAAATVPEPAGKTSSASWRSNLLGWSFALFNSLRIVAYMPTLATIVSSGHSDQHSLFTWVTFAGANATMALWLHEQNGHRVNRAIVVNTVNAVMCVAICGVVLWMR